MNVDEVDRYPFLKLDVQWIQQAIEATAAPGDLPRLATVGQSPGGESLSEHGEGDRLVSDRVVADGRRRSVVRPKRHHHGFPVARRHLRPAARSGSLGPRPVVPEPGISMGLERLRPAISHRDDRRDDRRVAEQGDESGELAALDYITRETIANRRRSSSRYAAVRSRGIRSVRRNVHGRSSATT